MPEINLEILEEIAVITIDRPKANAINASASREIYDFVKVIESEPNIRVGVITGAGEKFFSAGWDLKAAAEGERADTDYSPGGFAGITELFDRRKPLIAAVNGIAYGGGFELALACDLIVAAENASFALPEASLGIIADAGGVLRLPRIIGKSRAAEALMTGRKIDSQTALQWGLVSQVVQIHELKSKAIEIGKSISQMAPLSIAAILEIWQGTDGLSLQSANAKLREKGFPIHGSLVDSEDANEGLAAFNEKRKPRWSGK
jgi:crotonobetainyl-CoA hydratase